MKTKTRAYLWASLLGLCLLAVAVAVVFWSPGGKVGASSTGAVSLTTGQESAIRGAGEILLLTPNIDWVYLPVVSR